MIYRSILSRLSAVSLAIAALCTSDVAPAQIVLDGTMGTGGALNGPNYQIGAQLGQTYGNNLFHSFSQFNLSQGQSANFTGPTSIQNILSRVTGGSPSSIDGTLRSSIAGANLFFLNPSGVVFGPNAAIDVSGSLVVSTADVLKLQDGGSFHARNPNLSGLSSASPAAFGFLNQNPAPIRIYGSELNGEFGKDIALIGGNIGATGALITAPGGHIGMVSVGSPGEVKLSGTRPGQLQGFDGLGAISLNRTVLDVSQEDASTSFGDIAGSVNLRGRNLTLDNESRILAANTGDVSGGVIGIDVDGTLQIKGNSHIAADTYGSGHGADVNLKARDILLEGDTFSGPSDFTGVVTYSSSSATGNSGKITLNSESLSVRNGASLLSLTNGSGIGGDISVNAGRIVLDGAGNEAITGIGTQTYDLEGGSNGTIRLTANSLRIINGAEISGISYGFQNAGSIVIEAERIVIDGQDNPNFTGIGSLTELNGGRGGHIQIKGQSLQLQNGAGIEADDEGTIQIEAKNLEISNGSSLAAITKGDSNAGTIVLKAENIKIDGGESEFETGVFAYSQSQTGNAGSVTIEAKNLEVLSGGYISTTAVTGDAEGGDIKITADRIVLDEQNSFKLTGIAAQTGGRGNGGSIILRAKELNVLGAQISASSQVGDLLNGGNGGDIDIEADKIVVQGIGATISTATVGYLDGGDGGSIKINTGSLDITKGGQIFADTLGSGAGGSILIKADTISIEGQGEVSGVVARARESAFGDPVGNGGSISIETGNLTLGKEGIIQTSTQADGNGGEVLIKANSVLLNGGVIGSNTFAETGGGDAGRIEIQTRSFKLENGSEISAQTRGSGNGGDISIKAQSVVLDGRNDGKTPNDLTAINAQSLGSSKAGRGGDIEIHANTIQILNTAFIDVGTKGDGQGGNIILQADDTLHVQSGGEILASTKGSGQGGSIILRAGNTLRLQSDSGILAESFSAGDSGSIQIEADSLQIQNGSLISTATAATGNGGSISVKAKHVALDGKDSKNLTGIFASSLGAGDSGGIEIEAGSLQLLNRALVDATTQAKGKGGSVSLQLDDTLHIQSSAAISANTAGTGKGGDISIKAKHVVLDGKDTTNKEKPAGIFAVSLGAGNSGSIQVEADSLDVRNDSQIAASTVVAGKGGSIILNIGDTLRIESGASVGANTTGSGQGGDISIKAKRVVIDGKDNKNSTGIFAESKIVGNSEGAGDSEDAGDGGSIRVEADSLQLLNKAYIDATTQTKGKGGSISLQVGDTIDVESTSQISANTVSTGKGGDIFIKTPRLILDAKSSDPSTVTGIVAVSTGFNTPNAGDGGNVQVEADSIQLLNGSKISVSTGGAGNGGNIALQVKDSLNLDKQSGLIANTLGAGRGGDISVEAGAVSLSRGSAIEAASGRMQAGGDAGKVTVTARDSINLSGESYIVTAAIASNGGNLSLRAGNDILVQDGGISTLAGGNGGVIQLNAGRMLYLDNSRLFAKAEGTGGNILINNLTPNARFVIFDKSTVNADAKRGNGGDILIRSNVFIRSAETRITASSELREDGNIAIDSPNTNVGGSLLQLSNNLLGAENYLSERCTVRLTGQKSSFTINTRRALPPLPGTFLPSNVVTK